MKVKVKVSPYNDSIIQIVPCQDDKTSWRE